MANSRDYKGTPLHIVPETAQKVLGKNDQLIKNGIGHRGIGEGKYDSVHKMLRFFLQIYIFPFWGVNSTPWVPRRGS